MPTAQGKKVTAAIARRLRALWEIRTKKHVVLLIGGPSKVGKSTLAKAIKETLRDLPVHSFPLDSWIVSVEKRDPKGDVRTRFEYQGVVEAFNSLLETGAYVHPVYEVESRRRVKEACDAPVRFPEGIVIVEGVVALDIPQLRERAGLRVFCDMDDKLRLENVRRFYIEGKKLSETETEAIIAQREQDEVALIRKNVPYADYVVDVFKDEMRRRKKP